MANIGQWGSDIKFSVNSERQLSFRNMKRTSSARWASHNIIGKRPKPEFLGPGMDEVTLEVLLSAEMGVRPRSEMKKFRSACKKGDVHYLYINGKKVCANKMAITAVSVTALRQRQGRRRSRWTQCAKGTAVRILTTSCILIRHRTSTDGWTKGHLTDGRDSYGRENYQGRACIVRGCVRRDGERDLP